MSEPSQNHTTYRHKQDDSIHYEVKGAGENQYEVRRLDRTDIFGGEPFVVDAEDWNALYEPIPQDQEAST